MTGTPVLLLPRQVRPGISASPQDTTSSTSADPRNPMTTQFPRSERRNCASSNGMTRSLWNEPRPWRRSPQLAHRPTVCRARRAPTAAPASRRPASSLRVAPMRRRGSGGPQSTRGRSESYVAEVDHGNDTATATASPSAIGARRVRLNMLATTAWFMSRSAFRKPSCNATGWPAVFCYGTAVEQPRISEPGSASG